MVPIGGKFYKDFIKIVSALQKLQRRVLYMIRIRLKNYLNTKNNRENNRLLKNAIKHSSA